MTSFVNALNWFQNGRISKDELVAAVDLILEDEGADETWLMETLEKESTKAPFPDDVHTEVCEKIKKFAEHKRQLTNKSTRGDQVQPGGEWSVGQGGAGSELVEPGNSEPMKVAGDILNGRFVLEERIGTGGMSSVYKALDRRKLEANDRNPYVAVKVLNVEFRAHPDSLIALQREAKKSQSLAHPNIVRVHDFDRDGSTVYMTMELLSGKSLAKVLGRFGIKGLSQKDCVEILERVADALQFAHDNGIIHADFKPANVILTDENKVKVIDFGISRAFQGPEDNEIDATRFDPGSLKALTPTYASPEMLEHREPDPRDDVYSLACVAYEMLTGRHPYGRIHATEARDRGLELERYKQLSRRQWKALKSALDFDRDKRTPTVARFLSDMHPRPAFSVAPRLVTAGKMALVVCAAFLFIYYISHVISEDSLISREFAVDTKRNPETSVDVQSLQFPSQVSSLASGVGENVEGAKQRAKAEVDPSLPAEQEIVTTLASVKRVIEGAPCSAFDVSLNGNAAGLKGYVPRGFDMQQLKMDILALPGIKRLDVNLKQLDPEKCAVIDMLGPYWEVNHNTGVGASIQVKGRNNKLLEGQSLVIEIETPDYETYVNIDYFSLDGGVVHMVPSSYIKDNQAPASYRATIGDLGEWIVGEPFGSELIAVVMTPEPLFEEIRTEFERKTDYLKALEKRLKRLEKNSGDQKIVVDFVMIDTAPK